MRPNSTRFRSRSESGISSSHMGAPAWVSQWDSMAASLVGWILATSAPWQVPLDDLGHREDQGEPQGQAEGLGEKGRMLPPQQVIGADPHDHEAR